MSSSERVIIAAMVALLVWYVLDRAQKTGAAQALAGASLSGALDKKCRCAGQIAGTPTSSGGGVLSASIPARHFNVRGD